MQAAWERSEAAPYGAGAQVRVTVPVEDEEPGDLKALAEAVGGQHAGRSYSTPQLSADGHLSVVVSPDVDAGDVKDEIDALIHHAGLAAAEARDRLAAAEQAEATAKQAAQEAAAALQERFRA